MRIRKPVEQWFEIPDDPDNGKILLKILSPGESARIMDRAFDINVTGNGNKTSYDRQIDREMTVKNCILDWKNFFDVDGNELQCTDENKIRAINEIDGFLSFFTECRTDLEKNAIQWVKDHEKN